MIGRLTGIVAEKSPPQVLLDVQGVGYEVDVPMSTFCNLPGLGERVTLLTHLVVREDAQLLYAFLTDEERATFRLLIKISGIGPRTALGVVEHQLQLLVVDRPAAAVVQRLDERQRARRLQLAALDAEMLLAPRDDDVEPLLDRAQVFVEDPAHVGEAFVVGWGEGAADDHWKAFRR